MPAPRAILIGGCLVLTLTTGGCGAGEKAAAAPTSPSPTPTGPATPMDTTLQKPKAAQTIKPTATLSLAPGASQLPAPAAAPKTIHGFPVPPGIKVKGPGAFDRAWQFDIHTKDPDSVIAFYKRVLPQMGYTVKTDVTYTLGYEDVHWDISFDGPSSGTMARDPNHGVVFVVVNPPGYNNQN